MRRYHVFSVLSFFLAVGCSNEPSSQTKNYTSSRPDSLTVSNKQDIQNFWTTYRQATTDRTAGYWQKAVAGYSKALELNSRHTDARYYLANMYLELGAYQKAEENWLILLEGNPSSSRAHYQLGKLYLNKDARKFFDLDRATIEFQRTAEINRDFIQPVLHLAQISLIKGNYGDSKEGLQIILGSNNKNIEALFLLSYINFKEGDLEKAAAYFKQAKEFSIPQASIKGVKGEGDTKTGKSLEREVSQSIFFEYYKNLAHDNKIELEVEMKSHFTKMDNFILRLQNIR